MSESLSMDQAMKKAKKYPVPGKGQFVRFPTIEVYCAYLKLHGLTHHGFRGDMAIARRSDSTAVVYQTDDVKEVV